MITALLLSLLWPLTAQAFFHESTFESPTEPLRVEEAYRVEAMVTDNGLRIEWDIEEGYYLYRDKMHFNSETPGIALGKPIMPPGESREDPYFGTQVIYRNRTVIDIPMTRAPGSASTLTLAVDSQGCADMGICYPPRTERIEIALPALSALLVAPAAAPDSSAEEKKIDDLLALLGGVSAIGGNDDQFLPAEEAFAIDVIA